MWNPEQYKKFEKERDLPFYDLMELIRPKKGMKVIDLGCGTGRLTKILHDTLHAEKTVGIDTSSTMLQESKKYASDTLTFEKRGIEDINLDQKYDLVFSNAALQWVPDHPDLFKKLSKLLAPQGQIAIQIPSNFDFPTHMIAKELGKEQPFANRMKGVFEPGVLSLEAYATLLHQLGFKTQLVRMQIYSHLLQSTEDAVEWVKGSLLTHYQNHLGDELYPEFLKQYKERVLEHFGEQKPFFFPFKRMLLWGSLFDNFG